MAGSQVYFCSLLRGLMVPPGSGVGIPFAEGETEARGG